MSYLTLSSQEKHLFNTFFTLFILSRASDNTTSLNIGGPMHGPSPTSNFGETVPQSPLGLRPCVWQSSSLFGHKWIILHTCNFRSLCPWLLYSDRNATILPFRLSYIFLLVPSARFLYQYHQILFATEQSHNKFQYLATVE